MEPLGNGQIDYDAKIRLWEQCAPWWRRRSARIGIQGKLFIGFIFLLALAMGGSYYLFLTENRRVLAHAMGEHAVELSQAIAMASEPLLADGNKTELHRIGRDLLKNRDIVGVCFYDDTGTPLVFASQDPDVSADDAEFYPRIQDNLQNLMQVRQRHSPTLGHFAEVTVPVFCLTLPTANTAVRAQPKDASSNTRLVGYVSVSLSIDATTQLLKRVSLMMMVLGGLLFIISIPVVYALVNRILLPIRQLVVATMRIASGDYDAQADVEVHRPDAIGTLARAFNEMVRKVKDQQQQLAEANRRLAAANRDLEQKVTQRTSQLEAANKRLSSEIAEKEDFLRAVSHDLNAPLRNISGMATMLMMKYKDKFDEDIVHRLDRIQKNVQIETDLIGELLELSRIKTRRQKMEPVDVEAMVRELGDMFENDLKTKGIALTIDTPLPVLECERARIRQVFQNLIDNAIKYMGDKPGKAIHVGCHVRQDEAEFYVRDTGIGIEAEDLPKVFCVFRRGKSQTVQNVAGKGVGLASVKSIIETYSGSIWVESEINVGTTFRFTINGKHVPASVTMAMGGNVSRTGEPRVVAYQP
jgi:signal transduction histidine kinase